VPILLYAAASIEIGGAGRMSAAGFTINGRLAVAKRAWPVGTCSPVASHLCHEPHPPGVDIHVVQRLMGHSNIATTSRYLHVSDADLIDAIDRAYPEG